MNIVSSKPTITRKELEGVLDCLINDELSSGSSVKIFENNIAQLVELNHSLAVNSLTAAYHLIFQALEIDENCEIIIPSFFSQSPLSALSLTKGKVVLVDNMENSPFPSIEQIKEKITDKTKAIIIGNTFGYHFDTENLHDLDIPIIEDISHAIGTSYNDSPVGSNSTFAVASFSPSMVITTGNGGMVLTNNSKYYSIMRNYRGSGDENIHFEYTITDFQGAMGISQLLRLKEFLKRRREIARIYHDALRISSHKTLKNYHDEYAYQSFPVLFNTLSDKIAKFWKKNKIDIGRPIHYPLHKLTEIDKSDFPNCERLSKKLYTLPLYPTLTKKEIEKIAKSLSSFI